MSLNNRLIVSGVLTHSLFTLIFLLYVNSLTCRQVSLENRCSLAKIIKEPIPKLKLILPNIEFGDVNRYYDTMIRKIFLKILLMSKKWLCKNPIRTYTVRLNQILRFDVEKNQLKVLDKFYERDFLKSQK